jgi:NADH-quinone oxidoreductase subunit B
MHAFITLQKKIDGQHLTGEGRPRHLDAEAQGEFPVPVLGAHDLEPASNPGVWPVPLVIQGSGVRDQGTATHREGIGIEDGRRD